MAGNIDVIYSNPRGTLPIPGGAHPAFEFTPITEYFSEADFAASGGEPNVRETGLFRVRDAERKLGGRAEVLTPHPPHGVFIWFGGPVS